MIMMAGSIVVVVGWELLDRMQIGWLLAASMCKRISVWWCWSCDWAWGG